jgi:hypothetical protein
MAVLAIFTGKHFTKAMYESLRSEVKWEANPAAGALIHVAGFDSTDNIHVADVWETEDQMNAFVGAKLVPAFQKHKIPMPDVVVYPMHNLNVFSPAKRFMK